MSVAWSCERGHPRPLESPCAGCGRSPQACTCQRPGLTVSGWDVAVWILLAGVGWGAIAALVRLVWIEWH